MHYVDGDDNLDDKLCSSFGPYYSWNSDPNIPGKSVPEWVDREASLQEFEN